MQPNTAFSDRQLKQAIKWFVHLQSESCNPSDHERFAAWLSKTAAHAAAYAEAGQIWTQFDDVKPLLASALADARKQQPEASHKTGLAAGSVLLLVCTLGVIWQGYSAESVEYVTGIGERRHIVLADNSEIDMNANTRLSATLSWFERSVELSQGEALFTVSHKPLRPFSVTAGNLRITDIGTRFDVKLLANRVTVAVLDGEVELDDGRIVKNRSVTAGKQFNYSETLAFSAIENLDKASTAWLEGQLVFKHTPLREVAAELERYHAVRFVFTDQSLEQETLSGSFAAADLDPFLHAVEQILPIQAKRDGNEIKLKKVTKK